MCKRSTEGRPSLNNEESHLKLKNGDLCLLKGCLCPVQLTLSLVELLTNLLQLHLNLLGTSRHASHVMSSQDKTINDNKVHREQKGFGGNDLLLISTCSRPKLFQQSFKFTISFLTAKKQRRENNYHRTRKKDQQVNIILIKAKRT